MITLKFEFTKRQTDTGAHYRLESFKPFSSDMLPALMLFVAEQIDKLETATLPEDNKWRHLARHILLTNVPTYEHPHCADCVGQLHHWQDTTTGTGQVTPLHYYQCRHCGEERPSCPNCGAMTKAVCADEDCEPEHDLEPLDIVEDRTKAQRIQDGDDS